MDLKITPTSSGSAPETTVTPPTPTSPPARGIRGNRSGSLSNTPSKLSQSMTHPLTPTAEGMSSPQMAGVDDSRGRMISAEDGTNGKSGGGQGANSAGGFFSSMISAAQNAAQNAATTLSNTVANNIVKGESTAGSGANTPDVGRSRSGTETDEKSKGDTSGMQSDTGKEEQPRKRLAVETLGQGELSLGSLGISTGSKTDLSKNGSSTAATAVYSGGTSEKPEMDGSSSIYRSTGGRGTSEDVPRVPGGTQINTETAVTDTPILPTHRLPASIVLPSKTPMAEDIAFNAPPIHASSPGYENTTPNADDDRDEWLPSAAGDPLKRSGSAKSNRGSGVMGQVRRPRGSSAASSLANHLQSPTNQPQSPASPSGPGPKITGFAVASKKRNRDFHALFRSVPEDDYLIEDYGCALQKDILLHGRLYVSEGHICFNSNILGWINTLVISFDEVMAIEKKSTALLFPNAIVIQTLHARNVFASFISRDTTYDLLVNIWKISHPGLIPSVAGYTLEKQVDKANGAGDGRDKSNNGSESEDEYDEDEEGYEEEDDDDDEGVYERECVGDADGGFGDLGGGVVSAPNGAAMNGNVTSIGAAGGGEGAAAAPGGGVSGAPDAAKAQDFPGPATHSATDCGDHELHYERIVCDEYLPGPLGKVYALLFGSQSNSFLTKFFEDQKVMELSIPNNAEWAPSAEAGGKSTRGYSYIRPLPGGIGPKQTKCICTEQLEQMDLEKAVSVLVTTQTPDVPSGNQFSVKTRYCLTWGDGSMTGSAAETRMQLNCTIEWTGKSWLKGPIEKGCNDGQITHGKDLTAALKRELEKYAAASKPRGKGGAKGGKKGKGGGKGAQASIAANSAAAQKAAREKVAREKELRENAAWGVLLPLKPVLAPLVEMAPGGGMGLLIGVGVLLVIICAFTGKLPFFGKRTAAGDRSPTGRYPWPGMHGSYPDWEQSWYAEEQGLWDWLEDRVGLNAANMGGVPRNTQEERRTNAWNKLNKIERNQVLNMIGEVGGIREKEIEEAMKVMEKRLEILRAIVNERKAQQKLAQSCSKDGC
ncbi:hypothetical protein BGX38DRAFT_508781 [Terfezia claveryi]|nr:hypothetical protein BGX38DRAFT_508781 [Terfezia claveryi]